MIVGQSVASHAMLASLRRFASCAVPVLLEGETGTGKELAAREIHYAGPRAQKPFVPVNCGALPDSLIESELFGHRRGAFTDAKSEQPGLVELAHGGTLFLDEVDTLSPKAQVTLLRFLQDREYRPVGGRVARVADVRIVAATNASLEQLSLERRFRRDLYYRLNALYLRVQPLRERVADIAPLAQHFLEIAARQLGAAPKRWTDAAFAALAAHAWPGNVRELENVALRAYVNADGATVGVAELAAADPAFAAASAEPAQAAPRDASFSASKARAIASFERTFLTNLLRDAGGNVTTAAKLADIERRQLGKLLKKHGIARAAFREPS
ncbi:sigma 54-interacting transcriptional regulator [Tahibacter soli]|jgi:DNA-binding NtrC family response regulator|uniref:Sigma-54 dependent transcriptional regulator n=1 Tax=Tahibacter soli TaxID=2983605 RepID=A0A9X4BN65_9GAMM|nr:sigma-54 dependent transcriptional regulator [Tahibacter soli]MDC8016064.1 sigma-54 dependent transcriptional regulator [Tahibacter soli]